ncbi:carbon-nitrogen hydrolase family protein [Streptomyces spectabilis]|uniref:Carbon-nitrogen hydrolase family protein n=1 Tax=Streptomyces spectabilis TaxID=68270 RepID=A0A516RHN2_STRST|nr:carbon-nitrogen hydrolase family protein [Streptomyces spectabilis]QDQ15155.1 carbon-nitrogen hydrolase family protein [Streptomyces spectabilis]
MSIFVAQHARRPSVEATAEVVLDDLDSWVTPEAKFVVLPENVFGDDGSALPPTLRERCLERLAGLARRRGTYVLTGSWTEERSGGGPVRVTRLLDPAGSVRARVERPILPDGTTGTGDDFPVVETEFGHVGVLLGPDFWLVEPPRIECLAGAELLLVAGSLDGAQKAAQRAAVWGIATLNTVAVAFASSLGGRSGGGSAVAMPEGFVAEGDTHECVLEAPWDAERIRHLREPDLRFQQTLWFGLWARRPDLYAALVDGQDPIGSASKERVS